MDWKSGLLTFAVIFLAELGDKTQLMVMSMSARSKSPQMVFFGAALALIASSLLAVAAGDTLLRMVPLRLIRMATGAAFVLIGGVLVIKSMGMK
ncbi:MAG TPA: TMEM165/GDT1 family protein [Symbiobacteriaceae bacterium]|nr:TMEM165/GDT1 family protein [Symbiobacteriaceae bacterium]